MVKYTGLRKQVYDLAKSIGVDTKTMGGRRVGRGIDNLAKDFLPTVFLDLKELQKKLGINYKLK